MRRKRKVLAMLLSFLIACSALPIGHVNAGNIEKAISTHREIEKSEQMIFSFSELEKSRYIYEEKPDVGQLASIFPDAVEGVLEDGTRKRIPVVWEPEHDLKTTSYTSYLFHAVMDTDQYKAAEEVSFPVIEVQLKPYAYMNRRLPLDTRAATYELIEKTTKYNTGTLRVGSFKITGGIHAFCVQHQLDAPEVNDTLTESAVYTKATDQTSEVSRLLRKVLYYGWGGPADIGTSPDTSGGSGQDKDQTNDGSHYRRTALAASVANQNSDNYYGYGQRFIDYLDSNYPDAPDGFEVHKLQSPRADNQDLAFYRYNPKGKLQLTKKSANPELTDGNACYSLEGAQFGVYTNANGRDGHVGTLTTDADGKTNTLELNAGTYYVKETKAPKGYALSSEIKAVEVTSGAEASVSFEDLPQLDPVVVLLGKIDAETNKNKPQGSASLQGAQFTVKYYDGLWEKDKDPAEAGRSAKRTWVFETDEDGFCTYDDEFKVSGDALYMSPSGLSSLPIGTITIQETKAPEGYHRNPQVYVMQITSEGTDQWVQTYNQPKVPENIFKLDLVKKQAGTDLVIPGAVFEHTKPDGTTERFETQKDGMFTMKGLQRGTHTLREVSVMDGYEVNGNAVTFKVAEDNTVTLTSAAENSQGKVTFTVTKEGNVELTVEDRLSPFALYVHKINEKKQTLEGAEFTLYSDKACTKAVKKGVTAKDGSLSMTELIPETSYYLKETKAPKGYRLPLDLFGREIVYEIRTESVPVKDTFTFYVDGKAYDSSSDPDGRFTVKGTKAEREVHMTVLNETGKLLPETGGIGAAWLLAGGSFLLMLAAAGHRQWNRKRRIRI